MPSIREIKVKPAVPDTSSLTSSVKKSVRFSDDIHRPETKRSQRTGAKGRARTSVELLEAMTRRYHPSLPERIKQLEEEKLMDGPVSECHGMKKQKLEHRKRWRKLRDGWNDFKYVMEPWGKALRSIEGHHGTGVVSYFVLLRYLLLVNFCMFLMTLFIWVPEVMLDSTDLVSGSTAATCTAAYSVNVSSDVFTLFLDFFQGSGWLEKTALFYGHYSGNGLDGTDYKLSLAYILVCIFCLVLSLLLMGRNMASNFRESILNAGDGSTQFCNKVFGNWDFTLSDEASAVVKHRSVRYELLSDLNEKQFLRERESRLTSACKKCALYTVRIIINIFIVLVLGASGYIVFYVTDYSTAYVTEHSDVSGTEAVLLRLLIQFLPAITMAVLNGALPIIFQKVVQSEQYTTAYVIKITLIRTVFLRLASLTVLMVTLYSEVTCSHKDSCTSTISPCNVITCWETYVGQQLYKLIIMDFLVVIIKTLLVELPRRLLYDKCSCGIMQKIGPPEFDIPANVLDLVYSQCLYWLSLTFAPLTPSISVFKVFITFYLKMLSALKACPPAQQPYRASRSNTFFMLIMLAAFFLCTVPVGYTLYTMEPSHGCGPFRTYSYMYYSITTTVESWPATARSIYTLVISPAVTAPFIIFLCLLIYYCSVLSSAHKNMSDMFREQLVMEGRDKQFLMARVRELSGEAKPLPPKPHRVTPPAITRLQNVNETA
ncbi:transmembrane channel-like protein 7 [Babylonia areolata]|uniref:transmembrane channel-like protein 7 n=1 Tax=Babylonia areolata TaxID=304850 RepID=UPI003FD0C2C5